MMPRQNSPRNPWAPTGGACDACRRRKVKCDTAVPCANCTISRIPCEHRTPARKRGRPFRAPLAPDGDASASSSVPAAAAVVAEDLSGPLAYPTHMDAGMGAAMGASSDTADGDGDDDVQDRRWLVDLRVVAAPWQGPASVSPAASQDDMQRLLAPPCNPFVLRASNVFGELVSAVEARLDGSTRSMACCVRTCVDLFMQYQFPNTPIAHEATLRSVIRLFDGPQGGRGLVIFADDSPPPVEAQRAFTLITALCALVFSAMPEDLLPGPRGLIWPFYHASRAMLKLYEEIDLETPHSSSYYIRTWQSAALQNTTGRDWASWHIHGEGTLLAMRARIYDEATISLLPRLEARLLRVNFWLMYLADKTAAAFEARPHVINDDSGTPPDEDAFNDTQDHLLDVARANNQNGLESRLMQGFHLKRRLWAAAADLVREIRLSTATQGVAEVVLVRLTDMYMAFTSLADCLPGWLQSPHSAATKVADPVAAGYQVTCFWAQRSNIMTVYHCMRLVILQKCAEGGIPQVVGVHDDPASCAVQELGIARDFLNELQMAPFACFKAQGEPAVERVRRVGSILVSIVNGAPTPAIEARARHQLDQLLDILTSLDSRATDGLGVAVPPSFVDLCW